RSATLTSGNDDVSAHMAHDAARDGQAQTCAAMTTGQCRIHLLELFEQALSFRCRNAGSRIQHTESDSAIAGARGRERNATTLGKLDAIAGKIDENLTQACR